MKNADLIAALQKLPGDAEVFIWLPGSYVYLTGEPRVTHGRVLVEGNLKPGSALCDDSTFAERDALFKWARGLQ